MSAPTLPAYAFCRTMIGSLVVVWCVHCKRWHWHELRDSERAPHRPANCNHSGGSPYLQTGYVLDGPRTMSAAIRTDVCRRARAHH